MVREGLLEKVMCAGTNQGRIWERRIPGRGKAGTEALGTLCMFEERKPVWPQCGGGAGEWNGVRLVGQQVGVFFFFFLRFYLFMRDRELGRRQRKEEVGSLLVRLDPRTLGS